jgi:hypothetical protein
MREMSVCSIFHQDCVDDRDRISVVRVHGLGEEQQEYVAQADTGCLKSQCNEAMSRQDSEEQSLDGSDARMAEKQNRAIPDGNRCEMMQP